MRSFWGKAVLGVFVVSMAASLWEVAGGGSDKGYQMGTSIDSFETGNLIGQALAAAPPQSIEVGFSPGGGAEGIILKTIASAQRTIRVAAYSFTSPAVTKALIQAKRRGVDVQVVADHKHNLSASKGAAISAFNLMANSGIRVRTVSGYAIFHDKFIVADGLHVQTGSFNYSSAAARSNSENVVVIWSNPVVANEYIKHWQSRFDRGVDYRAPY